jgi:hypothetical protein
MLHATAPSTEFARVPARLPRLAEHNKKWQLYSGNFLLYHLNLMKRWFHVDKVKDYFRDAADSRRAEGHAAPTRR